MREEKGRVGAGGRAYEPRQLIGGTEVMYSPNLTLG